MHFNVRVIYLLLFLFNAIFAELFKSVGEDTLSRFGTFQDCDPSKNASCRGHQMIFRASFSICVFFAVCALRSAICLHCCQRTLHTTNAVANNANNVNNANNANRNFELYKSLLLFTALELPVYLGLLIGSFFIPASFFDVYAKFARITSFFFIVFQIISIIDFAYNLRDTMLDKVDKYDKEQPASTACVNGACMWKLAFIGVAVGCFAICVTGVALLYKYYGECREGIAFTTITLVVSVLLIGICALNWMGIGILPPSVVSMYLMLMCWEAVTNQQHCQSFKSTERMTRGSIIYNALMAAFAMTWSRYTECHEHLVVLNSRMRMGSWRTSNAALLLFNTPTKASTAEPAFSNAVTHKNDATPPDHVVPEGETVSQTNEKAAPNQSQRVNDDPWLFYCMMVLASVYMAMVLTNWDSEANTIAMWVKIASQWTTMLLFAWTLAAPKLFPDRDFS